MEKVRFCEACGKALILDKEHHKVVRNTTDIGLAVGFGRNREPQFWDAFECEYCGCQTIIGERKRDAYQGENVLSDKDITEDEEPQDGQISSSEEGEDFFGIYDECEKDDVADIKKKIEEAGE